MFSLIVPIVLVLGSIWIGIESGHYFYGVMSFILGGTIYQWIVTICFIRKENRGNQSTEQTEPRSFPRY